MVAFMVPLDPIEVREYLDRLGRNRFSEWFTSLDEPVQLRISTSLARVRNGNLSNAKSVGAGVQELRLDFGPGYRIYFGRVGTAIVILPAGGTKRRQQADLVTAQALWQEFKERKQED
jgi:putative addiction module killer protein